MGGGAIALQSTRTPTAVALLAWLRRPPMLVRLHASLRPIILPSTASTLPAARAPSPTHPVWPLHARAPRVLIASPPILSPLPWVGFTRLHAGLRSVSPWAYSQSWPRLQPPLAQYLQITSRFSSRVPEEKLESLSRRDGQRPFPAAVGSVRHEIVSSVRPRSSPRDPRCSSGRCRRCATPQAVGPRRRTCQSEGWRA